MTGIEHMAARKETRRLRALHRLVVAAVKHADAIEEPKAVTGPDKYDRSMSTGAAVSAAAIDFARSLSKTDRERFGR